MEKGERTRLFGAVNNIYECMNSIDHSLASIRQIESTSMTNWTTVLTEYFDDYIDLDIIQNMRCIVAADHQLDIADVTNIKISHADHDQVRVQIDIDTGAAEKRERIAQLKQVVKFEQDRLNAKRDQIVSMLKQLGEDIVTDVDNCHVETNIDRRKWED